MHLPLDEVELQVPARQNIMSQHGWPSSPHLTQL